MILNSNEVDFKFIGSITAFTFIFADNIKPQGIGYFMFKIEKGLNI